MNMNARGGSDAGYFENLSATEASGWAVDPRRPGVPVMVAITIDSLYVYEVVADQFRKDLQDQGYGSGCHGFTFRIPDQFLDNKLHEIDCRVLEPDMPLLNTPRSNILRHAAADIPRPPLVQGPLSPDPGFALAELPGMAPFEDFHRYVAIRSLVSGKNVLEVGCGDGYGASILAQAARQVLGVDPVPARVQQATRNHARQNLEFSCLEALSPALASRTYDVVVCFQALTEIPDTALFLKQVKRVLKRRGLFILSTPNRDDPASGASPQERSTSFTAARLGEYLRDHFKHVALFGQQFLEGSFIDGVPGQRRLLAPATSGFRDIPVEDVANESPCLINPSHLLAFASNVALPVLAPSVLRSRHVPNMSRARVRALAAENETQRATLAAMQDDLARSANALSGQTGQVETLLAEIDTLRSALRQYENLQAASQQEGAGLRLMIDKLTGQIDALERQHASILDERGELHDQVRELQAMAHKMAARHDALLRDQEAMATAAEELAAIHAVVAGERDALAERLRELREDQETLAQERDALLRDKEAMATAAEELAAIHAAVAGERDALAQRLRELREDQETLAQERDALLRDKAAMATAAEELQARLLAQDEERQAQAARLRELQEVHEALAREKEAQSDACKALEKRLRDQMEAQGLLEAQVRDAQRSLKEEKDSHISSLKELFSRNLLRAEEINELGLEIATLREAAEMQAACRQALEDQRQEADRKLEEADRLIAALRRNNDEKSARVGSLEGDITFWKHRVQRQENVLQGIAHFAGHYKSLENIKLGFYEGGKIANKLVMLAQSGYLENYAGILVSGLFEHEYYREQLGDSEVEDLIEHYITVGWQQGLSPHPLFDNEYYLGQYPDVAEAQVNPFAHFLANGWSESRNPHPLFDTAYYFDRYVRSKHINCNPLIHYLQAGGFEGANPCRLFDSLFYLEHSPDVFLNKVNPLVHYLRYGYKEDRKPHPMFDPVFYRRTYMSEADQDANPLSHYCRIGQAKGYRHHDDATQPVIHTCDSAYLSTYTYLAARMFPSHIKLETFDKPTVRNALAAWHPEAQRPAEVAQPVNICITVYRGHQHNGPFFDSLFANTPSNHRIFVVDNGNEDPEIIDFLRRVAREHPQVRLIRVEKNAGYINGICRAFQAVVDSGSPGHLVLLNTDTVLPPGWLPRIMAPILLEPNVASVTPVTNAGTVCSFPIMNRDNPLFSGLSCEAIDVGFQHLDAHALAIELPSAVGFCMAMNRQVIDQIGYFDAETFGMGYSEENDWSLRAVAYGYKNVLAPNLFVYHKHGGTYLPEEKRLLLERNLSIIEQRYPGYGNLVGQFCETDVFGPYRGLVALRLFTEKHQRGAVLIIDHNIGGGANLYRDNAIRQYADKGVAVVLALINSQTNTVGVSFHLDDIVIDYPYGDTLSSLQALRDIVSVEKILVNNLVSFNDPMEGALDIQELAETLQSQLVVPVHDYFWVCPSFNLLGDNGSFCDIPDLETCRACLPNVNGWIRTILPQFPTIDAWRQAFGALLERADSVICFSPNSKSLIQKAYPSLAAGKIAVTPHHIAHFPWKSVNLRPDDILHIGLVGDLHYAKGSHLVRDMIAHAQSTDFPVKFTVIGEPDIPLTSDLVTVSGRYRHEDLCGLLEQSGANVFFVASVWPETFSYVTEELIALGLPVASLNIGAPAERLRHYAKGHVLQARKPREILQGLQDFFERLYRNKAKNR